MDLKRIKIFSELKSEEIEQIKLIARKRVYPKGTTIFVKGQKSDGVYIIYSGQVKISLLHHDGREKTLAILGEGEILGEVTLYGNELRSTNVEALEVTTLLIISNENFHLLLQSIPTLSTKIIELLSNRLRHSSQLVEELTFFDARKRVISSLIYLSSEKGIKIGNETHIIIPLTHSELAKLAGVTRETTTKVLNELQNKKLIKIDNKTIKIADNSALNDQLF